MVVSTYATLYATDQAVSNLNPINDPLPDQIRISEIIAETKYSNSKASFQAPDTKIGKYYHKTVLFWERLKLIRFLS